MVISHINVVVILSGSSTIQQQDHGRKGQEHRVDGPLHDCSTEDSPPGTDVCLDMLALNDSIDRMHARLCTRSD